MLLAPSLHFDAFFFLHQSIKSKDLIGNEETTLTVGPTNWMHCFDLSFKGQLPLTASTDHKTQSFHYYLWPVWQLVAANKIRLRVCFLFTLSTHLCVGKNEENTRFFVLQSLPPCTFLTLFLSILHSLVRPYFGTLFLSDNFSHFIR